MTDVKGVDGASIAHHISTFFTSFATHDTYVLLMGTYRPCWASSCLRAVASGL